MQMRICFVLSLIVSLSKSIADEPSPFSGWKIIDLTHALDEKAPVYPGSTGFILKNRMQLERGFYMNDFTMAEHFGTHVDAPSHKARKGDNIDNLGLAKLNGPLVVVDVRHKCTHDADYAITLEDIRGFELEYGEIPEGAFVFAYTGWCDKWETPNSYVNIGEDQLPHFPGFSADATQFLVVSRKTIGMGIDTLSTDPGVSTEFLQHKVFLASGGINVENLANLSDVPCTGAFVLVAPLKIKGGSGAPARVLAFVRNESPDCCGTAQRINCLPIKE